MLILRSVHLTILSFRAGVSREDRSLRVYGSLEIKSIEDLVDVLASEDLEGHGG